MERAITVESKRKIRAKSCTRMKLNKRCNYFFNKFNMFDDQLITVLNIIHSI